MLKLVLAVINENFVEQLEAKEEALLVGGKYQHRPSLATADGAGAPDYSFPREHAQGKASKAPDPGHGGGEQPVLRAALPFLQDGHAPAAAKGAASCGRAARCYAGALECVARRTPTPLRRLWGGCRRVCQVRCPARDPSPCTSGANE